VIGVVALVLIGPKDLPVAIRAITRVLKRARRMAGEFQHHVDDMMREADLGDVQSTFRDLRGMNLKNALNRVVDSDGSVGRAFADPFAEHVVPPAGNPHPAAHRWQPSPMVQPPGQPAGPAPDFIPPREAVQFVSAVPPPVIHMAPDFVPPADAGRGTGGDS